MPLTASLFFGAVDVSSDMLTVREALLADLLAVNHTVPTRIGPVATCYRTDPDSKVIHQTFSVPGNQNEKKTG